MIGNVSCLTDNSDGTITLRLVGAVERGEDGKPRRATREVLLLEPTALEYAQLRTKITACDAALRQQFPAPEAPTITEDMTQDEANRLRREFQSEFNEWARARKSWTHGLDSAPYANCVIEAVKVLSGESVTLADLPVEAFDLACCAALLETWEAPLGGPAVLPQMADLVAAAIPAPEPPTEPTAADSPDTDESSLPTTEPATQSLPPT
jgi:hypothetical protein